MLAGLGRRLAALVYEMLLLAALLLVASFALAPLVSSGVASRPAVLALPGDFGRALSFIALIAIAGGYFVWSWTHGRRTLAQKTWRVGLVSSAGAGLAPRTALLRYVACGIGPALALGAYVLLGPWGWGPHAASLVTLNWLWAVIDPERQFLHDRIAGTRLVATNA